MTPEPDVSIGEVYRICLEIREAQKALDADVRAHAEKLAVLEDRSDRGARLGGIWGAIGGICSGFVSGLLGGRT